VYNAENKRAAVFKILENIASYCSHQGRDIRRKVPRDPTGMKIILYSEDYAVFYILNDAPENYC